jgi:hypothetical protein
MDDTASRLVDLEAFFEQICRDYKIQIDKIENIKLNLFNQWNDLKSNQGEEKSINNSNKNCFNFNFEGNKTAEKEKIDLNAYSISYSSGKEKESNNDNSNASVNHKLSFTDISPNTNKNKSYLGKIYMDSKINFNKGENQNLKRKSIIIF